MPAQRTQQDKLMPISFPSSPDERRAASKAAAGMHMAAFKATKATQTGQHSKLDAYSVVEAFDFRTDLYNLIEKWGASNLLDTIEEVRKNAEAWSQKA